ncbi:MAG: tetratricopeptide repeat protein [Betaproteobacteria bacterium]|nr:tetratricopeptide repeat protein [Betaproteobacteria bacterium]
MNTRHPSPALRATLIGLAAFAFTVPAQHAAAGNLWYNNPHESIAVPLESHALGVTRAKQFLAAGAVAKAEAALKKIIARFPTSTEAHALLARLYAEQGKAELASLHAALAQRAG